MEQFTNNIINKSCDLKDKDEVVIQKFSNDLENALKDSVIIENEYKNGKRKGYNNVNQMMMSITEDNK